MNNDKKPRICEVLGVEVGEEWEMADDKIQYRIDKNGDLQYQAPCEKWKYAPLYFSYLVDYINGKRKIKCKPHWTQEDIEDAKAVKQLWKDATEVRRGSGCVLVYVTGGFVYVPSENFPSLKLGGDAVELDEILEVENG